MGEGKTKTRSRMPEGTIRDRLAHAADTGRIVRSVYARGTQPGTYRDVRPLLVNELKMTAHDLAAGIAKTFKLEAITIPDDVSGMEAYDPERTSASWTDPSQSIAQNFEGKRAELEAMGWHVELERDRIGVHGFFQNGKPRKGASTGISYHEMTHDHIDLDGVEHYRKAKKPYYVWSKRWTQARSYGKMKSAAAAFMAEAKALAPSLDGT